MIDNSNSAGFFNCPMHRADTSRSYIFLNFPLDPRFQNFARFLRQIRSYISFPLDPRFLKISKMSQ